jgi:epoxide hydrolase 4
MLLLNSNIRANRVKSEEGKGVSELQNIACRIKVGLPQSTKGITMKLLLSSLCLIAALMFSSVTARASSDLDKRVEHGYADSNGVKIHYASLGKGPLVVMIHGFPDFWYSWRDQMEALSSSYQVVAIDQRGYNLSDKPKGVENYDISLLVGDVAAVIKHLGRDKAIIVGHDWGGIVAWTLAMARPDLVDKLIILNLPHPKGLRRELLNNPQQQKNSQYARNFQKEDAHKQLTAEGLSRWVKDAEARKRYVEAFNRSDFESMLNYYKRNYPREPYTEDTSPVVKVKAPVLMIHGLKDTALLAGALNNTWEWLEKDLTLVTIPDAGHFVQQDASDMVTRTIKMWLAR